MYDTPAFLEWYNTQNGSNLNLVHEEYLIERPYHNFVYTDKFVFDYNDNQGTKLLQLFNNTNCRTHTQGNFTGVIVRASGQNLDPINSWAYTKVPSMNVQSLHDNNDLILSWNESALIGENGHGLTKLCIQSIDSRPLINNARFVQNPQS
ncbi:MAG: hypothetical protein EOP34_05375 [Rickettsiales bacterium]|nr:MAG: hypothetical protein EOP34_05375 [Rickettsiales bacterium]